MKLPAGYLPGHGLPSRATAFGGVGQRMLERMGWQEGQGLGKHKHGMKDAIEVKEKKDVLGVGATECGWRWDWKYWEDAYNTAIAGVGKSGGTGAAGGSTGTSSDSSDADGATSGDEASSSEDIGASYAAMKAVVASAAADSTSSGQALSGLARNPDGTMTSATAEELAITKALARDRWGRFGGKEGKLARIRAQEAEQAAAARAKLGLPPLPAALHAPSRAATTLAAAADAGDSGAGARRSKRKQPAAAAGEPAADKHKEHPPGAKRAKLVMGTGPQIPVPGMGKARTVVVLQLKGAAAFKVAPFTPTPREGWWGATTFVSAGPLEGLEEQALLRERAAFSEGDQEALYNKAQSAQRQGKRGLGKGAKLKIAGGAWQGKKTQFAEEGEVDEAAAKLGKGALASSTQSEDAEAAHQGNPEAELCREGRPEAGRKLEHERRQRKQRVTEESRVVPALEAAMRTGAGNGAKAGKGPKWVKIAAAVLEAEGGHLPYKVLWRRLWRLAVIQLGPSVQGQKRELREQCLRKLEASRKVEVQGKQVVLAAGAAG